MCVDEVACHAVCRKIIAKVKSLQQWIEPILVERDTDYAGFLDEIWRTGILIESE
ncbi:MAG: hypothetical protein LBL94_09840 [Prevotellaceae bacterium]|nr:hypothetical protein [Prevotellaceae bacterium]